MLGTSLRSVRWIHRQPPTLSKHPRSLTSRSQGSSYKKRIATSNVAPPHISSEYAFASAQLVSFAMFTISIVRRRVASKDWCASRHVVSMISTPGYSRTAFANASGPFSMMILRQPSVQDTDVSSAGPFSSSRLLSLGTTISSLRPGSPYSDDQNTAHGQNT